MYLVLLVNILLSQLNLEWDGNKLVYAFEYKGKIIYYEIETSFEDILEFLGIESKEWHNIISIKEHYDVIKNCFIMNTYVFYKYSHSLTHKQLEFLTEFQMYALLDYKKNDNLIPKDKDLDSYIDGYFNSNIAILKEKLALHSACPMKDKFNGKLAIKWINELGPGELLKDTLIGFKNDIKANYKLTFNNFLLLNSHISVKLAFITYYRSLLPFNSFEDDLPF
jgi:hypothetical protein